MPPGRPRVHFTEEQKRESIRQAQQRYRARLQARNSQPQNVIYHYVPPIPNGDHRQTYPLTGLFTTNPTILPQAPYAPRPLPAYLPPLPFPTPPATIAPRHDANPLPALSRLILSDEPPPTLPAISSFDFNNAGPSLPPRTLHPQSFQRVDDTDVFGYHTHELAQHPYQAPIQPPHVEHASQDKGKGVEQTKQDKGKGVDREPTDPSPSTLYYQLAPRNVDLNQCYLDENAGLFQPETTAEEGIVRERIEEVSEEQDQLYDEIEPSSQAAAAGKRERGQTSNPGRPTPKRPAPSVRAPGQSSLASWMASKPAPSQEATVTLGENREQSQTPLAPENPAILRPSSQSSPLRRFSQSPIVRRSNPSPIRSPSQQSLRTFFQTSPNSSVQGASEPSPLRSSASASSPTQAFAPVPTSSEAGASQAGPKRSQGEWSQAEWSLPGPSEAGPSHAGPSHAGSSHAGPSQARSSQAGPSQAGPSQAGPSQAGPSQAGPSQAGPSQAGPSYSELPVPNPADGYEEPEGHWTQWEFMPPWVVSRVARYVVSTFKRPPSCDDEQHERMGGDGHPREWHSDEASRCCNLGEVASVLQGTPNGAEYPDVLKIDRTKRDWDRDMHMQLAFEGTTKAEEAPPRLCMAQHHAGYSSNEEPPRVSYDIDSILLFPQSLAFAKRGIKWLLGHNPHLNLQQNVHLGLPIPRRRAGQGPKVVPIHHIPHIPLGSVIGIDMMLILIFFPQLYNPPPVVEDADGRATRRKPPGWKPYNILTRGDFAAWYDDAFRPALREAVDDPNFIQHVPISVEMIKANTFAPAETARRGAGDISAGYGLDGIDVEGAADSASVAIGTAAGEEGSKEQMTKQTIGLTLGAQHLAKLDAVLRRRIQADAALESRFGNFVIYAASKNNKLSFMASTADRAQPGQGFYQAVQQFDTAWESAIDETYIDPDTCYVDLARQVTADTEEGRSGDGGPGESGSPESGSRASQTAEPGNNRARTYLWRNCCLDTMHQDGLRFVHQLQEDLDAHCGGSKPRLGRVPVVSTPEEAAAQRERNITRGVPVPAARPIAEAHDGREQESKPRNLAKKVFYPWAMTGEAGDMTIAPVAHSVEYKAGLAYFQAYSLCKIPFDAQKRYVFESPFYEDLALDASYLQAIQQSGKRGRSIINRAVLLKSYIRAKRRAHKATLPDVPQSFGVRAESRLSLSLFRTVVAEWDAVDEPEGLEALFHPECKRRRSLPYFDVATADVFRFLRAQLNRHCILFERILSSTTGPYIELAQTIAMVVALRSLRFCYGSNLIQLEPLLFGDEWQQVEWNAAQEQETRHRVGLGMYRSMVVYGFGWWKKGMFDWPVWRFGTEANDKLLVGNLLMREEYRRREWQLKSVRQAVVQIYQAQKWFARLGRSKQACEAWLEYLHCLCLQQFDTDVWREAVFQSRKSDGVHEELRAEATERFRESTPPVLCYDVLGDLFFHRKALTDPPPAVGPHLTAGNRMSLKKTESASHVDFLFDWKDRQKRKGWSALPYRTSTQRAHDLICKSIDEATADQWFSDLKRLVLLTRWILPYPSPTSFFSFTKQAAASPTDIRRVMWISNTLSSFPPLDIHQGLYDHQDLESRSPGAKTLFDTTGLFRVPKTGRPQVVLLVQNQLQRALHRALRAARATKEPLPATSLLAATRHIGTVPNDDEDDSGFEDDGQDRRSEHGFTVGRVAIRNGAGAFIPVVEAGQPPKLRYAQAATLSYDETERWMEQEAVNLS